jgi:RES domain-containing protein
MTERRFEHGHAPVYRVVRARWGDPLDASFSRRTADRRWNTSDFPALYCCCSVAVARAVALDVFRTAGVEMEDLQPDIRPQLVEIEWRGDVVDMVTEDGVIAAGFAADYPRGVDRASTRAAAEEWHRAGAEGVCARSASVHRRGYSAWQGDHRRFGELTIDVDNATAKPRLRRRRDDHRWLRARARAQAPTSSA